MRRIAKERRRFHLSNEDLFNSIAELCTPGGVITVADLKWFGAEEHQAKAMLTFLNQRGVLYIRGEGEGGKRDRYVLRAQGPMGGPGYRRDEELRAIRDEIRGW